MKFSLPSLALVGILAAVVASCSIVQPLPTDKAAAFEQVKTVLETNCVQCHGKHRYQEMPALTSTRSLAGLIGPGRWIVPGKPEQSRFFAVVTAPGEAWGAMPPTGHSIGKADVRVLRAWIKAGAIVPEGNVVLKPRGDLPLAP